MGHSISLGKTSDSVPLDIQIQSRILAAGVRMSVMGMGEDDLIVVPRVWALCHGKDPLLRRGEETGWISIFSEVGGEAQF